MKQLTLIVFVLFLGCAHHNAWVDLGNCGVKAACMKAAIEYSLGVPAVVVYGTERGIPHVEVMALIDGKLVWAYWVEMDYKADIIDFYSESPVGFIMLPRAEP
jgi:hypothetical protein